MKLLHFFRYKTERAAFTLVEMMIVIAVLGLLFLAVRSFSTDASINQERSTRLANAVHDILRDARHDTTVGKSHNGESVFRRIVRIISSGTSGGNMVTVKYLTGNTDISTINFDNLPQESTFSAAFDGDANYSIEKIEVFTGTLSNDFANPKREGFTPITVEALDLHFTSDIAGTAYVTNPQPSVNSSDIKSYLITLDYKGFKRYVYGDVLVGNSHVVIQDGGSTNERIAASEGVHESAQSCPVWQDWVSSRGACMETVRSCHISNGTGQETLNTATGNYENCTVTSCNAGYHQEGNSCISNTKSCESLPTHATNGTQTWNGSGWGACQVNACENGYHLGDNACHSSTRQATCEGTLPNNAQWKSGTNPVSQNYDIATSTWTPALPTSPVYDGNICGFVCLPWSTYHNGQCKANDAPTTFTAPQATVNGRTIHVTSSGISDPDGVRNTSYTLSGNGIAASNRDGFFPNLPNGTYTIRTSAEVKNGLIGIFSRVENPNRVIKSIEVFANCPAGSSKDGYTLTATLNHNATRSVTKTQNGTPANGSTNYTATATCDNGTINISGESSTFTCHANYHKEGNSCVSNTRQATCGGTLPANAKWKTNDKYTQTYNATNNTWAPTGFTAVYNAAQCGFVCNDHYTWNGSSCVPPTPTPAPSCDTITPANLWNITLPNTQAERNAWKQKIANLSLIAQNDFQAFDQVVDNHMCWGYNLSDGAFIKSHIFPKETFLQAGSIDCSGGWTQPYLDAYNAHVCAWRNLEIPDITACQPVYRHANGVTLKAGDCAIAGQEYSFEWKTYYIAKDKDDLLQRSGSSYYGSYAQTYPLDRIITTRVTDMSELFSEEYDFRWDHDISNWDTSNVTNMNAMFYAAVSFNWSIEHWDTSNVTDMSAMFNAAITFNRPIGNWDTSNVTNMAQMFAWAYKFNQPIGNWDTSNVTNMAMMFWQAQAFNQDIWSWDVSNVKRMSEWFMHWSWKDRGIFEWARAFNQNLSSWNLDSIEPKKCAFFAPHLPVSKIPFKCSNSWDVD